MAYGGLGRGLGSLIPQKNNNQNAVAAVGAPADGKDRILKISPDKVAVNPFQPRKRFSDYQMDELVESIREYGIIQPLIVTEKDGGYELIAGERRLRAAKKLSLKEVPAIIRDADRQEKLELALIENIQRENLNPVETAQAYRQLLDEFNLTQENLAKRVGKPRSTVTNILRMLNLPEEIQLALMEGKITEGHAKLILGLDTEVKQMSLFRKIAQSGLTVETATIESRKMGGTKASVVKINYADKDKEFALREFFGARAKIKRKKKGGQIIIDFYSDEELAGIIKKVKA